VKRLYETTAACGRLKEMGVKRAPTTMKKLRCTGGGPKFRMFGGKPYYEEADLIAWVEEGLSAPVRNTSEAAAAAAAAGEDPKAPPRRSHGQIEGEALLGEIAEPAVGDPLDEALGAQPPPRSGQRRSAKPPPPQAAEAARAR
jgi:hypothetical protein